MGTVGSVDLSRIPVSQATSPVIQAKLTINRPRDQYEQEADRVAEEVVQWINNPQAEAIQHQPLLKDKDVQLYRKSLEQTQISYLSSVSTGNGLTVSPSLETAIQHARGSGEALPGHVRQPMEQAFRADFSGVRIHRDAEADRLNRLLFAHAFTTGQDIFFKQGEYRPGSSLGQKLLSHELTHVVQQLQTSRVQVQLREGGHSWLEQASLEIFIPRRLSEIGARAGMSSEDDLIRTHDQLFNVMVPTNPWRGYDKNNVRRASLGGAIFELLARTPWETHGDVGREALGGVEASMGLFQAYPQYVARALTNPALRQWMWGHGDPTARQFLWSLHPIEELPGRELPREQRPTMIPYEAPRGEPPLGPMSESFIRRRLRGTASPIMDSFYLSLAGKIQHTLSAIMELDRANPVMRTLSRSQQLRIWMDYETNDCDHGFYARGDFQNEHESREVGEMIDLRSYGSAQRHVMAHLGFSVWEGTEIPNPPRRET